MHLMKGHKERHIRVSNTYKGILSIVQIRSNRLDMAWTWKVLVIVLVIAPAITEKLSLPPANFFKDFALKYQRSSIVMNIPKKISHNQVVKRYVI